MAITTHCLDHAIDIHTFETQPHPTGMSTNLYQLTHNLKYLLMRIRRLQQEQDGYLQ